MILTDEDIILIRLLRRDGMTIKTLSDKFDQPKHVISMIVRENIEGKQTRWLIAKRFNKLVKDNPHRSLTELMAFYRKATGERIGYNRANRLIRSGA